MTRARSKRAWVLMEMTVALTIFVFSALAVLGAMGQAISQAERSRDRVKAVDLARSTLAKLEAGLGTPQNLSGPVPEWVPTLEQGDRFDESLDLGFDETPPEISPWEVEVDTLPGAFDGLTHVTVTVVRRASAESDRVLFSYALHQLVRLAVEGADEVGSVSDITREAERGAPDEGGRP